MLFKVYHSQTCFTEQFPIYLGSNKDQTTIYVVDSDPLFNIAVGAATYDSNLLYYIPIYEVPLIGYYSS